MLQAFTACICVKDLKNKLIQSCIKLLFFNDQTYIYIMKNWVNVTLDHKTSRK